MTENDSNDLGLEPPVEALKSLPVEAEPSGDLWPSIESRLAGPDSAEPRPFAPVSPESRDVRRWNAFRPWFQAAAAIALFAAGAASGLGRTTESTPPASSMDEALALAAEVQRTGSEYVAALAAFTSVIDVLSSDVRGQGTHAAFATLYSAADQLAALSAHNPDATRSVTSELARAERRVRF